jgi:hypothetical protein
MFSTVTDYKVKNSINHHTHIQSQRKKILNHTTLKEKITMPQNYHSNLPYVNTLGAVTLTLLRAPT